MGLLPSLRILTMSLLVLLCLALTARAAVQYRTFEAGNPFPIGGFHNLLHPSPTINWPNLVPVREAARSSRQNPQPPANPAIAAASFIPLGSSVPLEPEHRVAGVPTGQPHYDPAAPTDTPHQHLHPVPSTVPLPPPLPAPAPLVQQSLQPQPQHYQPQVQQFQPQVQQFQPPPLESPRPPYGAPPPAPLPSAQPQPIRNHEPPRQNSLVWPTQQQQQPVAPAPQPPPPPPPPAQDRAGYRNNYASSRPSVFDNSPTSQFAHRSFEMPPSPAELGFPSVSNTQENWNFDINWADFGRKRRRRSPQQRPSQQQHYTRQSAQPQLPVSSRRRDIYEGDNLALEDRRAIETRVPAPSRPRPISERERHEREGNAFKQEKQEYDGPYVYTQLFGPPYEVGYIRSPIPSKHVYEDYLQFVRSWSSASREAVDDQLRTNPSAIKNYASSKYTETSPAYKESSKDSYRESSTQAYKEVEYKEPVAPAYKEPEYREPAFKGPSPSYKEPAYKDPVHREPEYKEPAYTSSAPAYKEPEYKEPAYSKEPEYKEPAYKEPEPSYKDPAPAYKEPEYQSPAPAYKEPAYSKEPEYKEPSAYKEEDAYRGQTSTEPVFRGETYRESFKETAHKSPAYIEEAYQAPNINYHSPKTDYVAPDSEFRPTGRPYQAPGPKSPVVMERDFVPIKNQNGGGLYDTPTTYRTPTATRDSYSDGPATYDILKPFEKANRPSSSGYASAAPSYDSPPTAVYEPVTAKYKPAAESYADSPSKAYEAPKTYDAPAYEVPKRYETPPEAPKKYEAPPQRKPSPSVAYYQPPTRYVEPPQYNNGGGYKGGSPSYETSSVKYESPAAQSYDAPSSSKYSEPAYDSPKKLYQESSTKYAETALYISTTSRPTVHKSDGGYRIEPLTTPAYKETYPADDYASSGYKDDVELSSTSYQAVAQNYDNVPKGDYQQPPTAYDQVRKPEESAYLPSKEDAYAPAPSSSYGDEPKKADDGYSPSAESAPGYEASTGKKKHYPVIIGRYQVTDSSAFLPKKVDGSGGGKSVGSHVHGSNGDEYVVYYLPYGQPLPIPVRKRRSAIDPPEEPVYTVRRYRNLAEGQPQRRKLRGQKRQQLEEQVLSPEEAHKLLKFPVPSVYRTSSKAEEAAAEVANPAPVVESQNVAVKEEEELLSLVVNDKDGSAPADEVKEEIAHDIHEEVAAAPEVPPAQHQEEAEVEHTVEEEEHVLPEAPVEDAQEENTPEPQPLVGEEEAERGVQEIVAEEQVAPQVTPDEAHLAPVQDEFLAQIEEDVAKGALIPLVEDEPEIPSAVPVDEPSDVAEEPVVGEIIIVKEVEIPAELVEERDEAAVAPVGGVANVNLIAEEEEQEVVEPPAIAEEAFITHENENEQDASPPVHYKKKKPGIIDTIPVLPGLTQRPVKYLRPPGIATDPQEHWNGYSTWWTKLGNRVAKIYNYE